MEDQKGLHSWGQIAIGQRRSARQQKGKEESKNNSNTSGELDGGLLGGGGVWCFFLGGGCGWFLVGLGGGGGFWVFVFLWVTPKTTRNHFSQFRKLHHYCT